MIDLLNDLLSKDVDILVGGHYVHGKLTCVDIPRGLAFLDTGKETWIVNIEQIGMVKQS